MTTARVLLIDNYDSFTHNLYQQIAMQGAEVWVHRNDALSLADVERLGPSHIVLSPGPGHPANHRDFGLCGPIIDELAPLGVPILGVCLGHQGIVQRLGGVVSQAPEIVHGKTGQISHDGEGIFRGLPQPMTVMRYHSLVADSANVPDCLEVTARLGEPGKAPLIMAVAHKELPLIGVQFHPESIGTPEGDGLIRNFLALRTVRRPASAQLGAERPTPPQSTPPQSTPPQSTPQLGATS